MIVILLIGLVFVGVAAGLFARSLLLSRRFAAETVSQIGAYGFEGKHPGSADGDKTGFRKHFDLRESLDSMATKIGGSISTRVSSVSEETLRKYLQAAGLYTLPPRRFVGYQALSTIVAALLWLWFVNVGDIHPLLGVAGAALALFGGWILPLYYVKRRGRLRGERIDYEMPELIDTLVTTVEAGLSFSASLQVATKRFRGPMGDELRLTLQEQSMGLALTDALNHMLERCDTPAVRSFVRSILQGEQLGVSIGHTLRNLAREMRQRRKQMAEERAHKAPVKIIFPLVLLIFPALMLVILGPAFIQIRNIFH
jgi:tight adherence protein C